MALVTRCPDCFTVFRVTPLHLQAHGGEVRCGQCNHIFNGFAVLLTIEEPETIKPVKTGEAATGETAKASEGTSRLSPDVAMSHAEALQDGGVPEPMRLEPHISEPIPSAQNPPEPHTSEPGSLPVTGAGPGKTLSSRPIQFKSFQFFMIIASQPFTIGPWYAYRHRVLKGSKRKQTEARPRPREAGH